MHAHESSTPPPIVLATLNAKYIHASLGLRYLLANMEELRARTVLREFTIARDPNDIAKELLNTIGAENTPVSPIIGFGVYIWNVTQTAEVLRLIKAARSNVRIVLGGPEVSHEQGEQAIVELADHVISGWGDRSFPALCRALLSGAASPPKFIAGEQAPLDQIAFPYNEYTDDDLAHRLLYVEASRGCPFRCEFCLSALDKTAWAFELDAFLAQMDALFRRGARNFKFVDRTFNLDIESSVRILRFFLDRLPGAGDLFLHFEVVPDHLPARLKDVIALFPPGVLQFEVGVQSFNPEVQQRIARKQNNARTEDNLRWLMASSNAHVHADLIFGLPGESLESFAAGFDRLYALRPHEIQLGVLKRLRGTPIARHTAEFGMVYDAAPPYTVQQTACLDTETVRRFTRLARYWDCVANSGRFPKTLAIWLSDHPHPFEAFLGFADWLWATLGKTNGLSPEVLVDALFEYLCNAGRLPETAVRAALLADYVASGARSNPRVLQGWLPRRSAPSGSERPLTQRQERHRATRPAVD